MPRKICVKCGKRKNQKSFPKHIRFKDGFDSRCKNCVKKEAKLRNKLHKQSPVKPLICPVCNRTPENFVTPYKWHLDHDPELKYFRGWLCESCNMSGGKLGDTLQSGCNWMSYLLTAKRNFIDEKLYAKTKC